MLHNIISGILLFDPSNSGVSTIKSYPATVCPGNLSNGTSTSVLLGAPGQGLDRSGWRHIAFTRTGTTYKLWLDGGQYTSTSTTMLEPKYQGTIIPKIGRLGDSTMGGWDSYSSSKIKIDSVSVWNRS